MELIELTASVIATLVLTKAIEKSGEKLGEAVLNKINQLLNIIRSKFKVSGVEGILTKAQENPTGKNKSKFQNELIDQMEEDEEFAKQLKKLVEQIKAQDEKLRQVILSEIELTDDLKAKDVRQKATRSGAVEQEMLKKVKARNIDVENLSQEA